MSILENVQAVFANADAELAGKTEQITDLQAKLDKANADVAWLNAAIEGWKQKAADLKGSIDKLSVPFSTARWNLNLDTGWKQPSNAGDTGGSDTTKVNGTFILTPGNPAKFYAKGNYPYNNGLWYNKKSVGRECYRLMYALDLQFPSSADMSACQAIEFELQHSWQGYVYNMAWQCQVRERANKSQFWRTFDYTNKKWEDSQVPTVLWTPFVYYRFMAEFLVDTEAKTVTHTSLGVNDAFWYVGITRAAKEQTESDYVSVGFQLDSDGNNPPTPYSVLVKNMQVLY